VLGRLDVQQQQQIDNSYFASGYFASSCISVSRLLAERGFTFRGEDEVVQSPSNGNYLRILESLADYSFLTEHIRLHANRGSGHTNYLSSTVWERDIQSSILVAML